MRIERSPSIDDQHGIVTGGREHFFHPSFVSEAALRADDTVEGPMCSEIEKLKCDRVKVVAVKIIELCSGRGHEERLRIRELVPGRIERSGRREVRVGTPFPAGAQLRS